jgi:ElaB/YqjD/DUF883 family membrane-anchored ribosome-binding protein
MAQTRSESPRQTDPRAQPARAGDGAPSLSDLDSANDPAGAEPMDLAAQIDSLLNEIEQASAAADPWGDAAQRAADKLKDDEERTLEPSQKLLAKVRDGVAPMPPEAVAQSESVSEAGVEDAAAAPVEATASVAAATASAGFAPGDAAAADVAAVPEVAAAPEPDVLAEALEAVLNESHGAVAEPSSAGLLAPVEPGSDAAGAAETSLAAELDAALKEAGDALEQIVPPEDPPAEASAPVAVGVGAEEVVDVTQPAPTAAAVPVAAAHWTNSGAGGAPKPVAAAAADVPAETPASTGAAEAAVDADDLDAALAEQAEELEESSRAAQSPAPATVPAEAPPVPETEAAAQAGEQPVAVVTAEAHTTASAAAVPTETSHVTQHSTVTATANKTTTAAAHATVRTDANAPVVVPEAKPTKPPAPAKPSLWARVRAPMDRVGNVLATPLAMLPESARDIVAYLAAVTVFNAMAVWTYMLFIYTPVVAPPAHDAPALHATEPVPQTHGEHGDGHAPAGHGGGEHDAAKAEGHAKTSADAHAEKTDMAHVIEHGAAETHGAGAQEVPHGEGAGDGAPNEAAPH